MLGGRKETALTRLSATARRIGSRPRTGKEAEGRATKRSSEMQIRHSSKRCGEVESGSSKFRVVLARSALVAVLVSVRPAAAQSPPQSAGWKGANNVIAEKMWGNGTTRNYPGTQQDVTDAANAGIRWSRFVVYAPADNSCTDPEMQQLL